MPQLPTFAEAGLPLVESGSAFGIAVPTKTPAAVQRQLGEVLAAVIRNPSYVEQLATFGTEPVLIAGQAARDYTQRETAKWRNVIKAAKVTLD
jgi:tripartite-type tricarboxylate transporter receptor subunit TctC